jgi:hypothetical protein
MGTTTAWVGDVDGLHQGCFHFRNASTFASLHVDETIAVLGSNADEILVEGAKLFRGNPGPGAHDLVNGFNAQMAEVFGGSFAACRIRDAGNL